MSYSSTELTPTQQKFLRRQIRNAQNYLYFSIIGVAVALGYIGFLVWTGDSVAGSRFGLIIVLLLSARGNLKQHKDAQLLIKFEATEHRNQELGAEQRS
jgi:hypothetical protein